MVVSKSSTPVRDFEQRLIELEIKVSYQEDLIQELNQVVSEQQGKIDQFQLLVELLEPISKYFAVATEVFLRQDAARREKCTYCT